MAGIPADPRVKAGAATTIVVRPQAMAVDAGGAGYPARVRTATYLGNMVEYELTFGEQMLIVEDYTVAPGQVLAEGSEAWWSFSPTRAYALPSS